MTQHIYSDTSHITSPQACSRLMMITARMTRMLIMIMIPPPLWLGGDTTLSRTRTAMHPHILYKNNINRYMNSYSANTANNMTADAKNDRANTMIMIVMLVIQGYLSLMLSTCHRVFYTLSIRILLLLLLVIINDRLRKRQDLGPDPGTGKRCEISLSKQV